MTKLKQNWAKGKLNLNKSNNNEKRNKKKRTSVVRSNVSKSPQASQAKMNGPKKQPAYQLTK